MRCVVLVIGTLAAAVAGVDGREAAAVPAAPTPATPMCGVANLASITAPVAPAPTNSINVIARGMHVSAMVERNAKLYVLDAFSRTVRTLSPDGALLASFTLPWGPRGALAVDADGNVYLARHFEGPVPDELVKVTGTGVEVWARSTSGKVGGLFTIGSGTGLRIGVVHAGIGGSTLWEATGNEAGTSAITGSNFAPTSDGGLVATDSRYVRRYDAGGVERVTFGDRGKDNDPQPSGGPFHFYQLGGAVLGPDGTFYVADAPRGIHAATPEGFYRGLADDHAVGSLTERSAVAQVGDRLYFANGGRHHHNQNVAWVSVADLTALTAAPKPPNPVLGFGAGLTSEVTGQYFPPGRAPAVTARFDPWWLAVAPRLRLAYTVRERKQVLAGEPVATVEVPLPTTAEALAAIPVTLPPGRPGAYEIDARLMDSTGGVVGATCFRYTVGASGHGLDFSALPSGVDYGGSALPRGAVLADQLGISALRASLDWAKLLPNGDPSATGPLNFAAYDAVFAEAAQHANSRGVTLFVLVGLATGPDIALVNNGTWESRVRELVDHYKGTVKFWEAWSEPNNNLPTADFYVSKVLQPFHRAVKAADASATVVGGSMLGVDVGYLDAIGALGAFSSMDVVAFHPYGGHNRSWEEQGLPARISSMREILARHQAAAKPIWNTEWAWWSNGPANYFSQGDKVARALLWSRALNIERSSYLVPEGGYGDYGLTYSVIEATRAVDFVKPAALAFMTAAAHTDGRPFLGMVDTGIPHTYAASFGGTNAVLAAWTDDLAVTANLVAEGAGGPVNVIATDVLGDARTITLTPGQRLPLALSGSPVYLSAPSGVNVRLLAAETFGPNLAAGVRGATATASSANDANPASAAIDGVADAADAGNLNAVRSAWASAPGDDAPVLTVNLAQPRPLNRVVVATHSNASVLTGMRDYTVEVQEGGSWVTVGSVRDQFFDRTALVTFPARMASAVRVKTTVVNYGGLAGGAKPWFWPSDPPALADTSVTWYGAAVVYEVEAYEPGGTTPGGPPAGAPPADFDGDGDTDIAVSRRPQAPCGVDWCPQTWFVRDGESLAWGIAPDVPVPADYDGDGDVDIAVYGQRHGTWWMVRGGAEVRVNGLAGDIPVPGDYDGDGDDDFGTYRVDETHRSFWTTNNIWTEHYPTWVEWGTDGDIPVPGDYDGDGDTDIAVFRPSNGVWFVKDGPTVEWGTDGDIPVPGDYDGDGDTDVAVFRPSDGVWFVKDGPNVAWGTAGDIPVPGDYDGDGDTDIAVFRPSNGVWFVRDGPTVAWGTSGDDPLPLPDAVRRFFFPSPR